MTGLKKDIDEAETTLKNVKAGEDLRSAIRRRHLGDLEKSMAHIRKNGWEKDWAIELKEGEKLAQRLRRLEKLKAEIMELKQSVISEIRSYQNPPPAVHKVSFPDIAFFLLESEPKHQHDNNGDNNNRMFLLIIIFCPSMCHPAA